MRTVKYLSPTSISVWEEQGQEAFYLKYLAEDRPEREPQTQPMSVGSAFDAYVKAYLHKTLFDRKDAQFEFETLFETQVEEHNRDWARAAGEHCFKEYTYSGALADLVRILEACPEEPRFEFEVSSIVDEHRSGMTGSIGPAEVTYLGKPDAWFITKTGHPMILDWKVNGYCSKSGISPKPGFVNIRGDFEFRGRNGPHKDCTPLLVQGIMINPDQETFIRVAPEWARQLSVYSWLCGAEVGSDFICGVDQLALRSGKIRVAQHRTKIPRSFQEGVYESGRRIWEAVHSDHVFRDKSFVKSQARAATLEKKAKTLRGMDPWLKEVTR